MLASLVRELIGMGLGDAKQVLLTGTSAGGVAAMLQADNVRAMLPTTVEVFKAISFAGWFRTNAAACKDATRCPWPVAMKHAFTMQDMRGSDDEQEKACLRKHGWRCVHSGLAARRVKAPLFVVQSALDSWSLANIWRGSEPEHAREVPKRSCIGSCFESCSVEETHDLNGVAPRLTARPAIPAPQPEPRPPSPPPSPWHSRHRHHRPSHAPSSNADTSMRRFCGRPGLRRLRQRAVSRGQRRVRHQLLHARTAPVAAVRARQLA